MTETLLIGAFCLLAGAAIAALAGFLVVRARNTEADDTEAHVTELARQSTEAAVRLETMMVMLQKGQSQFQNAFSERLDAVSHRVHQTMTSTTEKTVEQLQGMHERLAVIDSAQKNITDLASQVTSLRDVLSNKQARGAFGQGRMEAIVQDGLPKGHYEFQHTLANGKRPDCVVFLPDQRPLVIDAKFPLEAITALRESKTDDERKVASQRVRQDVMRHVNDISEKYMIPGETQDIALMFVPSESVYAELHDGFDDVVQKAYRAQVMLVSPTLLMLAIQVVQQIQKDARMREATDHIRTEVGHMMKDVKLLGERVRKMQQHFGQTGEDMNQILTSTGKIEKRATRIEELEFDDGRPSATIIPAPMRKLEAGE